MIQQFIDSPDLVHQAVPPLDKIRTSYTNPRKRISQEMIADLAASVAKVGVLQPILVRPHPMIENVYEIVAGECRYLASRKAGLEHIPATIRNLTDLEALELQVLENLHRNDLHPMEEAEGFRQLLDANGYTVATLAGKIGKSKAYVYAALKLCELCPAGRDAFFEGTLNASTALLIARIPGEALQKKALKQITKENYSGDIPSYREAARIIHQHYTLDLEHAIFDVDDPNLFPGAPDCQSCEKRSGNCRDLYPDIKSADVCTDPACFQDKRQAHIDRLLEDPNTISGKEAEELMPSKYYVKGDDYEIADSGCDVPGQEDATWEELLGDELPARMLIVDGRDPVKVVDLAAARQLAREKGLALEDENEGPTPEELALKARTDAKHEESTRRIALLSELHRKIADTGALQQALLVAVPMLIARHLDAMSVDSRKKFFEARNEAPSLAGDREGMSAWLNAMNTTAMSQLLVELAAVRPGYSSVFYIPWDFNENRGADLHDFYAILRAAGIDPEQSPETPNDPTSAAHAEIETARAEEPEAEASPATEAAQAAEADATPGETNIEAAVPAAHEGGRPKSQAAEPVEPSEQSQAAVPAAPKKRGRPKKVVAAQSDAEVSQ